MLESTEDDYVDELLARFRDPDEQQRRHAVRALARLGRCAVPALLEVLRQDDWTLRRYAVAVFSEAPDARAVPYLCEALSDLDWEVRREAARALKVAAAPVAAEALLPLLLNEAEHLQVRVIAIEALTAIRVQTSDGRVPPHVWERSLPPLCAATRNADRRLQRAAVELLGALQAVAAIDTLWAALGTAELEVAFRITNALGKIGGPQVLEPLRVACAHRAPEVRAAAARALGQVGGEAALRLLAEALRASDPFVRRGAALAVERLAKTPPTPALWATRAPLRRLLSPLAWPPAGEDWALFSRVLRQVEQTLAPVRDLPLPSRSGTAGAELPRPAGAPSNSWPVSPEVSAPTQNGPKRLFWGWDGLRERLQRLWLALLSG